MAIFSVFRTSARFAWRLEGFTLVFVAVAGLGLATAGVVAATYLDRTAGPGCGPPALVTCGASEAFLHFNDAVAGRLAAALGIMPFVVGTIMGAPLVARELEHRTAPVAWGLARSRARWLVWRATPVLGLLLIVLVALALAGDRLTAARVPLQDPARSFVDYGLRGPLVVARGLATFAVGLLTGVLTRRVLPALLVTLAFCAALSFASDATRTLGVAWTEIDSPGSCATIGCARVTEAFRDPAGRYLSLQDALAIAGASGVSGGPSSDSFQTWVQSNGYGEITIAITGAAYPEVETRELLAMLTVAAIAALGGVAALRRSAVG